MGVATLSGGLTAAVGLVAGVIISGATNVARIMDGERSVGKLAVSFGLGAGTSLIGSGVNKVVEKVDGNIAIKQLSKLSKRKLKMKIGGIYDNIKGYESNAIKSIDYLMGADRFEYLGSRLLGKTIPTLFSGVFEGGIGLFE